MRLSTLTPWFLLGALALGGCFSSDVDDDDDDDDGSGFGFPGGEEGGGADGGEGTGGGDEGGSGGSGDEGGTDEGGGSDGSDPNADDDGDGWTNAEEEAAGTNPDYEYSHPYTGDYNVGYCADGIASGSKGPSGKDSYGYPLYKPGDIAENFSLMDQHGEMVDLYSFCGQTVMLVFGAFW